MLVVNRHFFLFLSDKLYHTLEELSNALINREVDGVLIDTYAGGTHKELFSSPSLRVAQVIDYQTAYGVVIGGDSMRLRHCFYGYMRSHQAEIFSWVEKLVEPIKVSSTSENVLASRGLKQRRSFFAMRQSSTFEIGPSH